MKDDLKTLLAARALPPLREREQMREILLREEYGYPPDVRCTVSAREGDSICSPFLSGKCTYRFVTLTLTTEFGSRTLPVFLLLHEDGEQHPLIVYLDFDKGAPSGYFPVERIAERGADVAAFYYTDASSDDGDFSTGVAPILLPRGQDTDTACGKLGIWAFCASRVLDHALTLPGVDRTRVGVLGHSRLGKTALLAGMLDERFTHVFSNCAGCGGDALFRGNTGEQIRDIVGAFSCWFCRNFLKYAETGAPAAFDQHYLLACIAPRHVHLGAAELDDWADPLSQQLSCLAAGEAWERLGAPGFVGGERKADVGETIAGGGVAFHLRRGHHMLSYHDWDAYLDDIGGR